jgi:hypothetical protein
MSVIAIFRQLRAWAFTPLHRWASPDLSAAICFQTSPEDMPSLVPGEMERFRLLLLAILGQLRASIADPRSGNVP